MIARGHVMTDHAITFWTFVFTAIGVAIAAGGVFYAIKTLKAGAESLRLAAQEAKESTNVARAQFWVMVRSVMANYDDIHANLRPGGSSSIKVWSCALQAVVPSVR